MMTMIDAGGDDLPVRAEGPLNRNSDVEIDAEVPARHVQERDVELVVDGDALDDHDGGDRRLEQRQDDPRGRCVKWFGAVHERGLVERPRDAAHELQEDVDRDDVRADVQRDRDHRVLNRPRSLTTWNVATWVVTAGHQGGEQEQRR